MTSPMTLECVVIILQIIDSCSLTIQLLMDMHVLCLPNIDNVNITSRGDSRNCPIAPSITAFIICLIINGVFIIEVSAKIWSQRKVIRGCQNKLDLLDGLCTYFIFVIRIILVIYCTDEILRDVIAYILIVKFIRIFHLLQGANRHEKDSLLSTIDNYRRAETFNKEQVDIMQNKIDNHEREILQLKLIIKTATLTKKGSNNNLSESQSSGAYSLSQPARPQDFDVYENKMDSAFYDSGNCSDSAAESPRDEIICASDDASIMCCYDNVVFENDNCLTEEELQMVRQVVKNSASRESKEINAPLTNL